MSPSDPDPNAPTLTDCDREPIHIIGRVQSFAGLIAVDEGGVIQHATNNTGLLIGIDHTYLIGKLASDVLPPPARAVLQELTAADRADGIIQRRSEPSGTGDPGSDQVLAGVEVPTGPFLKPFANS